MDFLRVVKIGQNESNGFEFSDCQMMIAKTGLVSQTRNIL